MHVEQLIGLTVVYTSTTLRGRFRAGRRLGTGGLLPFGTLQAVPRRHPMESAVGHLGGPLVPALAHRRHHVPDRVLHHTAEDGTDELGRAVTSAGARARATPAGRPPDGWNAPPPGQWGPGTPQGWDAPVAGGWQAPPPGYTGAPPPGGWEAAPPPGTAFPGLRTAGYALAGQRGRRRPYRQRRLLRGRGSPDPGGRHELRYWDGTKFTEHVADGGKISTDPL